MSALSPTIVAEVLAACVAGAEEAAGALGRSLDGQWTLEAPESGSYAAQPPQGVAGPGLVILLTCAGVGLAIALPESTGILPAWYAAPDSTGESKLATLAQEFSMLLAPESLAVDKFEARAVASLTAALAAAEVAADAALVTLAAKSGAHASALHVIWPLANPAALFAASPATNAAGKAPAPNAAAASGPTSGKKAPGLPQLPHYSRSLLKIRIPISVHLATKKETVQEIVELVPGAIIKFDKGCDQLLQMVVGGQPIAEGEAVKIGDKFGFRITSMLRPQEHFILAKRPQAG